MLENKKEIILLFRLPSAKRWKAEIKDKQSGRISLYSVKREMVIRVYIHHHTGKCIRRFGGIYAYCLYFIDRKW